MKKLITICAVVTMMWVANANAIPVSVNTAGRPDLVGTISADGTAVYFNITAVGQADDGDPANPSKYYTQSNFDNEYFTVTANNKMVKYNMWVGNTTPYWGTDWGSATDPLPVGVTFSQTEVGDDFIYVVSMSYAALGISSDATFDVQIKARDFNDDFVESYSGFDGYVGEYSQFRGLYITDTGSFAVSLAAPVPDPSTLLLLGAGFLCLAAFSRKKSRKLV